MEDLNADTLDERFSAADETKDGSRNKTRNDTEVGHQPEAPEQTTEPMDIISQT